MTAREINIHYARVLAMRVTYVGELGWELHAPADVALTVYDALHEAGEAVGLKNVGLGAMGSLRLEKAYRDFGLDIDNTDTPFDVGLGFAVAMDKPGGFVGREALARAREATAGPPVRRLVQVLLEDPEPILYHAEPVLRDGQWFGHVRWGAYGHTLGGAVGLAMVEDEAGIPAAAIDEGRFEVDVAGVRYPARASIRPTAALISGTVLVAYRRTETNLDGSTDRRGLWIAVVSVGAMTAASALVAVQAPINAQLASRLGEVNASLTGFAIGTIVLGLAVLLSGRADGLRGVRQAKWWQLTGGLMGAVNTTAALLLVQTVGAAVITASIVSGQMLASVLIDRFGLFNMRRTRLTASRVTGILLLVIGVALTTA